MLVERDDMSEIADDGVGFRGRETDVEEIHRLEFLTTSLGVLT